MTGPNELSAKLHWVSDQGPQSYALKPDETITLGRNPDNHIVVPDQGVSRYHARISWDGSHYVLTDLESANGTFVNGKPVGRAPWVLESGDHITLDKFAIRFEVPGGRGAGKYAPAAQPTVIRERQEPAARPRLLVTRGPDSGKDFQINSPSVTIGRESNHADWEIRLSDPAVSRPHARIEKSGAGFVLVDLGSVNGTRLNGSPVLGSMPLKDGDVIIVGESRLLFRQS